MCIYRYKIFYIIKTLQEQLIDAVREREDCKSSIVYVQ